MIDLWRTILTFIPELEAPLECDHISEVMINPGGAVFIERDGVLEAYRPEERLEAGVVHQACLRMAREGGKDLSEAQTLVEVKLKSLDGDGTVRVAISGPPVSVGGTAVSIRKHIARRFTLDDLCSRQFLKDDEAAMLKNLVQSRQSILIAGATGSGKTTLLNAVAEHIPERERIVVIEDVAEIRIDRPNVLQLEARRPGDREDLPPVTTDELVRHALRCRPDRLIVGEVRGDEAWSLLQALNTGHAGSLSTIHADSAGDAIDRLTDLTLQAGLRLPLNRITRAVHRAFAAVVYVVRDEMGKRYVTEILNLRRNTNPTPTNNIEREAAGSHGTNGKR
jgi:pilus assembly protein CpaF